VAKIERKSLHVELVEALRKMILEGQFSADERIPELGLCVKFGVSRTPLREALKVLASENLIELEHNRGARLPVVSARQVANLFEVLSGYEIVIGTLAAARITEDRLKDICALHEGMLTHFAAGRRTEYFETNQSIHLSIAEATGNEELINLYRSCLAKIIVARYSANLDRTRWIESRAEHEDILRALTRRDGPELSKRLREHAEAIARGTMEQLAESPSRRLASA